MYTSDIIVLNKINYNIINLIFQIKHVSFLSELVIVIIIFMKSAWDKILEQLLYTCKMLLITTKILLRSVIRVVLFFKKICIQKYAKMWKIWKLTEVQYYNYTNYITIKNWYFSTCKQIMNIN